MYKLFLFYSTTILQKVEELCVIIKNKLSCMLSKSISSTELN